MFTQFSPLRAVRFVSSNRKLALSILAALCLTATAWFSLQLVHSAPGVPEGITSAPPSAPVGVTPSVTLDVPDEVLINEPFTFNVTFTPATAVGYGPFIDLILPAGGIDYNDSSGPCDGITFLSAQMVGVNGGPIPLTTQEVTAPCAHTIPGACATLNHPYASNGISLIDVPEGAKLVTIQLPFGSFEPDQPPIVVQVSAMVSKEADVNKLLNIHARAGFRFGADANDNPSSDMPASFLSAGGVSGCTLWTASAPVTPVLFTFKVEDRYSINPGPCFDGIDNGGDGSADSADPECGNGKTYDGPEDETVTGPNFPHHYKIILNIADGMTVTNLNVQDCLPNNMVLSNVVSTIPASTASPGPPLGPANSPNNCMTFNYSSILGGPAATDIVIEVEFYIPEKDADQFLILPQNCQSLLLNPVTSINDVKANALWLPVDTRDQPAFTVTSDVTLQDHILTDKCIAIQKSVSPTPFTDTGAPGFTPGDILRYKLNFQISDFKTFGDLEVTDFLSDGQELLTPPMALAPKLTVTDQFGTTTGDFGPSDLTTAAHSTSCGGITGGTTLTFKVSARMMSVLPVTHPRHALGILTGGWATTTTTPTPAKGTIVFFARIKDKFDVQAGELFVDKEDPLTNCVVVDGKSLTNVNPPTVPTNVEGTGHDDSGTAIAIVGDTLTKSVYAVQRGSTFICAPLAFLSLNGLCSNSPMPPQEVRPGDNVTFRIEKKIPSTDAEQLTVRDWLPLPIFNVTGFSSTIPLCAPTTVPSANNACFHPLDTLHNSFPPTFIPVGSNSIRFDYGNISDMNNAQTKIDLLFTSTVTNLPFADQLFLTNEVQECENNTFGPVLPCQIAIAQVNLREPDLRIRKGVIATDNPNGQFGQHTTPPSTVALAPPGVTLSLAGINGVVNHAGLSTGLLNSDLSNVDANDLVRFAITVENVGGHPAYDVKLEDIIPPDCFTIVPGTIQVKLGSQATFTNTVTPPSPGFTLTAPGPLAAFDPNNDTGANIIVITFQAQLRADITPGCCQNRAEIKAYASVANGPNFVSAGLNAPYHETAELCTRPTLTKSVVATSEPHTGPETSLLGTPQVVIGEVVRYRLEVRLPEGSSPNFQITDALPAGMKFLDGGTSRLAFVSNGAGITHTGFFNTSFDLLGNAPPSSATLNTLPVFPTIPPGAITGGTGCGVPVMFNLGNVQNADNDPDLEYIVIEFNALVCNAAGNQDGITLANTFSVSVNNSTIITSPASNVLVREPNLTISKAVSPATVVQGATPTYTVTITNAGLVKAFDVRFADTLPSGLILDPGSVSFAGNCFSPALVNTVPSLSCSEIPAGDVVTITYKALADPLTCPVTLTNNARVTWTSLPGNGTPVGVINTTGSITPGSSGLVDGERDGSAPTLNDYVASVSTPLTVRCPPCTPAPPGMVAWYPGEGNANDIQGGNHGTLQNGTTFAPGKVGQAFSFDGFNDEVVVAHNANQNTGTQITIDAWVNLRSSGHGRVIAQKRSASNAGGYTFETTHTPFGNANGLEFVIWIGSTPDFLRTPANVLTLNTFQHVAATYDGTTMKIFVNGVVVASGAVASPGPITPVTDPFTIGRNAATPSFDWDGLIDEVELFNRTLSLEEIQKIFNARSSGKCKCPTITLNPAPGALPPTPVNSPYTQTFTATGGCASSFTFTVTGGALPPGLTLSPGGVLSGTPTQQGDFTFTITATDSCGCSKSQTYALKVDCPIVPLPLFNTGVGDNGRVPVNIVGHAGNFSTIPTFDFATGATTAQFATGASDDRGRGVEVVGGLACWNTTVVYYTSITGDIHVAPYAGGSGGPDITVLPNPRLDGNGIQDLDYANGVLYAMTGYNAGHGAAPIVYALNPCTGAVLSSVNLMSSSRNSDGFTVLPNGDFLIDDGDGSATYRAHNPTSGALTGLVITLSGATGGSTGVDYNPTDNSLYFFANFGGTRTLARTNLSGNPTGSIPVTWTGAFIEDISVLPSGAAATDAHYTLTLPNGSTAPAQVLESIPSSYVPNSATSTWIGPGVGNQPIGQYTYRTTFTLTGCDPSTVVINGQWASDNQAVIRVNGVDTAFTTPNNDFSQFSSFTLNSTNATFHAGLNTLDFVVTNNEGPTGLRVEMNGTVKCCGCVTPITLNPAGGALPVSVVNTPYSQTFIAKGGDCASSFTYSVTSGALPFGLTLSANSVLSGTPKQPGDFTFTVTATDNCGCSKSQIYTLKVECPMVPLTLFNTGVADDGSLLSSGATDMHYALTLNGNPAQSQALATIPSPQYVANNATSRWIGPGVGSQPTGTYSYVVTFNMPAGADLSTAVIAGQWASDNDAEIFLNNQSTGFTTGATDYGSFTPFAITGPANFTPNLNTLEFRVNNSEFDTGLRVEMNGSVTCCPPPLPGTVIIRKNTVGGNDMFGYLTVGTGLTAFTITTSGGSQSQTFSNISPGPKTVTESALAGWVFTSLSCSDPDGGTTISGQTANIDLDPNETIMCTYTNTKCTITLNPAAGALPAAIINAPYSQTFSAAGGCTSAFTYSVTSGDLPPGLTLSANGVLSGTATQLGDFTFTVTAADSCGCSQSQTYTVKVEPLRFGTSGILISEFRFDGPHGVGDEFVELVNNTAVPKTITSTTAPGTGWSVWGIVGGAALKICTVPQGTQLAPGQHFLCAKTPDYELGNYALPDDDINNNTTAGLDADGGVALFSSSNVVIGPGLTWSSPDGPVFREDAVGFRKKNSAFDLMVAPVFREGVGLFPIGPQDPAARTGKIPDDVREYSFVRKHGIQGGTWSGPVYHDSNDNVIDWVLVSNIGDLIVNQLFVDTSTIHFFFPGSVFDPSPEGSAGFETATIPVFGAPGPQNLASPLERNYNTQFLRSAFDSAASAMVMPNSERSSAIVCGGPRGDLILRFTYKNLTGTVQNNLRVRFIDLPTINRGNASSTSIVDLLDSTAPGGLRRVFVRNGRDLNVLATGSSAAAVAAHNDPAAAPADGSGGNPSGDGIVNGRAAGGSGVKTVRGTYVEGVDKTPQVFPVVGSPPPGFEFLIPGFGSGNQSFRQVNPSWVDLDQPPGTGIGSPCRVGGVNSATVAFPPTPFPPPNSTTLALPATLPINGSISLEHRFGVIREGLFLIIGIIESN